MTIIRAGANVASTSQAGEVELATSAETRTATDTTRAVTPDGLGDYNGPRFLATRASFTGTADSWTKIQIDTEVTDTDGCYDNATNYRFTPTVAGDYLCLLKGGVNAQSGEFVGISIWKNGADEGHGAISIAGGSVAITAPVAVIINFNGSTDYIEAYAYASNATASVTNAVFSALRIG